MAFKEFEVGEVGDARKPDDGNPADSMRRKLVALGSESGVDSNNFISVILASGKEFIADSQTSITRLRYTGNGIEVDLETTGFLILKDE